LAICRAATCQRHRMTRLEENRSSAGHIEPVQVAAFSIADDALPFLADMQAALAQPVKSISPKHFYDARGSALFDRICELPEYYPTRTEVSILQSHAGDIAQRIGPHAEIIEFGAGSLRKVRILLAALDAPERYVPIDISGEHLRSAADALHAEFAGLDIAPLVADYTQDWRLPATSSSTRRRVAFFPGSTIGNFAPPEARQFLVRCARAGRRRIVAWRRPHQAPGHSSRRIQRCARCDRRIQPEPAGACQPGTGCQLQTAPVCARCFL